MASRKPVDTEHPQTCPTWNSDDGLVRRCASVTSHLSDHNASGQRWVLLTTQTTPHAELNGRKLSQLPSTYDKYFATQSGPILPLTWAPVVPLQPVHTQCRQLAPLRILPFHISTVGKVTFTSQTSWRIRQETSDLELRLHTLEVAH